jgi:hypothetical protein
MEFSCTCVLQPVLCTAVLVLVFLNTPRTNKVKASESIIELQTKISRDVLPSHGTQMKECTDGPWISERVRLSGAV